MRFPLLLLLASTLLAGCHVGDLSESYDLSVTPLGGEYLTRGEATLQIRNADGYTCPDGRPARIYFVDPVGVPGPRPLAVMLHGRPFDYVDLQGDHYTNEDRLNSPWAADTGEEMIGLDDQASADGEGAWVAALVRAGWSVAAPADCWGDLWHGRGANDYGGEGFLRLGSYLASEAILLAQEREDISDQRVLAIGLGEGGRGVTELILTGFAPDAVVIDSSPDWLAPVVTAAATNQGYVEGLLAIYDDEVGTIEDPDTRLEALRTALRRDSMVHAVQDLGFRAPIAYFWSATDERIDPETSRPAADAVLASYPPDDARVLDTQRSDHAPSNRDLAEATEQLEWLVSRLGPLPSDP